MIAADMLDDLTDDGDTVELPDGRTLRVRIESDPDTSINDFDCYGMVAWVERDRYTGYDAQRPAGFDGRALKLSTYCGDSFWWQPSYEQGMPEDNLKASRDHVIELVSYGFYGVIVELLDGTDAYHRPIVADVRSLWGIDDIGAEYVREVVADLVADLGV